MLMDGERIVRLRRATEILLGELQRLREESGELLRQMDDWQTPPPSELPLPTSGSPSDDWILIEDDDLPAPTMNAPPSHRDSRLPTFGPWKRTAA